MTGGSDQRALTSLAPAAARLGRAMGRPVPIAVACLVALAGLGWIFLALMVAAWAARGNAAALGPGMGVFDLFAQRAGLDLIGRAVLDVLCRPSFGSGGAWQAGEGVLVFLMWAAM